MTDNVKDFIEHYGTKGMRWGVRNDRSAASKLSTNAKTNGKDAYPGLSTKRAGHAGDKLKTTKASRRDRKQASGRKAMRAQARVAKKTLKKLDGKSGNPNTFLGRRKQRKIDDTRFNMVMKYSLSKPKANIRMTREGQEYRVKGEEFVNAFFSGKRITYDEIRVDF